MTVPLCRPIITDQALTPYFCKFSNKKIWNKDQENHRTIYLVKNEDLTLIFALYYKQKEVDDVYSSCFCEGKAPKNCGF